jgi:hypothetical protein
MSDQVPILRICGYCCGKGRCNGFDCLACKGAGMLRCPVPGARCPVPDAGYPDSDWLPFGDPVAGDHPQHP